MKIVGFEQVNFKFPDGHAVNGQYIYFEDDTSSKVTGVRTERVFLSDTKAKDCAFIPKLGDQCKVLYNRYGKVDSIQRLRV